MSIGINACDAERFNFYTFSRSIAHYVQHFPFLLENCCFLGVRRRDLSLKPLFKRKGNCLQLVNSLVSTKPKGKKKKKKDSREPRLKAVCEKGTGGPYGHWGQQGQPVGADALVLATGRLGLTAERNALRAEGLTECGGSDMLLFLCSFFFSYMTV